MVFTFNDGVRLMSRIRPNVERGVSTLPLPFTRIYFLWWVSTLTLPFTRLNFFCVATADQTFNLLSWLPGSGQGRPGDIGPSQLNKGKGTWIYFTRSTVANIYTRRPLNLVWRILAWPDDRGVLGGSWEPRDARGEGLTQGDLGRQLTQLICVFMVG